MYTCIWYKHLVQVLIHISTHKLPFYASKLYKKVHTIPRRLVKKFVYKRNVVIKKRTPIKLSINLFLLLNRLDGPYRMSYINELHAYFSICPMYD